MMSPEMREKLIRLIASFPAHERDLGPDNLVFADVIPLDGAELGDCPKPIERLADAILSLLATLGAGEGGLVACTSSSPTPPVSLPRQTADRVCALEWRPNKSRYVSGEDCWMGRIKVGSAFWGTVTRGDPLTWQAATTLPGIEPKEGTTRFATIEEAKARVERMVQVWLRWASPEEGSRTGSGTREVASAKRVDTTEPNPPARPEQGRGGGTPSTEHGRWGKP